MHSVVVCIQGTSFIINHIPVAFLVSLQYAWQTIYNITDIIIYPLTTVNTWLQLYVELNPWLGTVMLLVTCSYTLSETDIKIITYRYIVYTPRLQSDIGQASKPRARSLNTLTVVSATCLLLRRRIMPSYKLIYFNFRMAGEVIRFVFAQAGVKYEDVRVEGGTQGDIPLATVR